MSMPWSWWKRARVVADGTAGADGRPARHEAAGSRPVPEDESGDPIFEGGGQVLLRPSYWERAGWGIAVLATLVAAGPTDGAAPGCPGAVAARR